MLTASSFSIFAQGISIVPLIEAPNRTMNASLFASANPEAVKKYMPSGSAPASMSSFALIAGDDTVLFDTALGGKAWIKELTGVKPENVKLILITHFHGDHIGGLLKGEERRFPHAQVLCSLPEYESGQNEPAIVKIRSAYGQDFKTFEFDEEVFTSPLVKIKAIDAVGHTPGHTAFLVEPQKGSPQKESAKQEKVKLLIIGDLLHAAALQFPVPEACASFDADKDKAIASRKRILDLAVQEELIICGMHLPPPCIGTVKKEGSGYAFELK